MRHASRSGQDRMRYAKIVGIVAPILAALFVISCGGSSTAVEVVKHYSAGVEFQRERHFEEAITEFNEAIRLDPRYVISYVNRGNVYVELEQYERAISDFSDAIRIQPEFVAAYQGRAVAYILLGMKEKAQLDIDRVLELGLRNEQ